jgi:hypothetical protein
MLKIKKIYLERLRNETHYQFMIDDKQLIDSDSLVSKLLENLLPDFYNLIGIEGELVDAMRGSVFTEELADADNRRDRCLVGINSIVTASLHHFDDKIVHAAKEIKIRLNAFSGEMESRSYKDEAAAIKILIRDMKTTYFDDAETIGITAWVKQLETVQNEFDSIFFARNTELSQRPQEKLKDIRNKIDAVYRKITDYIDSYNVVNSGEYNIFIGKLNQAVDYYNEHSGHHAKKDIGKGDHAVIEPIETQTYTEKPITPLPVVYYREEGKPTVELVFSKDFTVTYKNNINSGTAELIVHGKGAYKGQKITTFNIARLK